MIKINRYAVIAVLATGFGIGVIAGISIERNKPASIDIDHSWPEVFTNPDFEYEETPEGYKMAIVDGLTGWGMCHAGNSPPESFGRGMEKIQNRIGEIATPENLKKLAELM